MKKIMFTVLALAMSGTAIAKLPPLSPEAQAAAAAAKEKAAHGEKVAAYKLCLAQDKTAQHYFQNKNQGAAKPSVQMPPCTDPGPFVPAQAANNVGVADAKPVPAADKQPTPAAK